VFQTIDSATFLIDREEQGNARVSLQDLGQMVYLLEAFDIPLEKDQAARPDSPETARGLRVGDRPLETQAEQLSDTLFERQASNVLHIEYELRPGPAEARFEEGFNPYRPGP
jgi:hypothetical protein